MTATEMILQNPDASMPLRVRLNLVCNTSEARILENVLINSRRDNPWISLQEAHDGVAIIVGSAPSLADTTEEIRGFQAAGATIFALNGAAIYLKGQGILADYQCIMDAQPRTIEILGDAKQHLLASQVDPSLFEARPKAILWHATYGNLAVDEQEGFPVREGDYCLIGGAFSVGNTAIVLAHAMGYRKIHVFGMDSSHRDGKTHARHQTCNDDDIHTIVEFNGKQYNSSLTMKVQAENFIERAYQLQRGGCEIFVHGSGLLPDIWHNRPKTEQEKYERMWEHAEYRNTAPGEDCVDRFIGIMRPADSERIIDFGCGTGRAGVKLANYGYNVMLVDFAANARDEIAERLPFSQCDLTKTIPLSGDIGFCTDVMEHIPTHDVNSVIRNIMECTPKAFFQISTVPDSFGSVIGQPLHLTVQPYADWIMRFTDLGYVVKWSMELAESSMFFVTQKGKSV